MLFQTTPDLWQEDFWCVFSATAGGALSGTNLLSIVCPLNARTNVYTIAPEFSFGAPGAGQARNFVDIMLYYHRYGAYVLRTGGRTSQKNHFAHIFF